MVTDLIITYEFYLSMIILIFWSFLLFYIVISSDLVSLFLISIPYLFSSVLLFMIIQKIGLLVNTKEFFYPHNLMIFEIIKYISFIMCISITILLLVQIIYHILL